MLTLLLWALFLLPSAQAAFVRRWDCNPSITAPTESISFQQQSLTGSLANPEHDGPTLLLKLTGNYESECNSLNGSLAQLVVNVSVLGGPVGFQGDSRGRCGVDPYWERFSMSSQGQIQAKGGSTSPQGGRPSGRKETNAGETASTSWNEKTSTRRGSSPATASS